MPSNVTLPAVGSISRSTQRPAVVLPEPDSPTSPTILPRGTAKLTSSIGADQPAAGSGKMLAQPVDDEERAAAASGS